MPDLPWTARAEMEPGTGYLVMASHLPLKRITATVRFFRAVSAVRKQLATAGGLIGYFPTYTLGNIFAAQLFAQASADLGNPNEAFSRGDFAGLLGWLQEKVHRHGHRFSAAELIEQATGSPPDHRPLVAMLRSKYSELYGV